MSDRPAEALSLERLTPTDAGELLTLQRAAFVTEALLYGTADLPPLTQTLAELVAELEHPGVRALGLRLASGRLVGSVRVRTEGPAASLSRLVVAPDLRGRGAGSRLLLAAETGLPEDVVRLRLFTGDRSIQNLRLYERHGYVTTRTEGMLVHMEKELVS